MSFWEDVRHPLIGGVSGLAYDAISGNGMFGSGDSNSPWGAPPPDFAGYTPGYDPKTMALSPELQKKLDALNLDKQALGAYQEEALRKGPSRYADLASKQQMALGKGAKDQARQAAAGTQAGAMSDLARSGGLSSGARERTARGGAANAMNLAQDVNASTATNLAGIAAQDEQNRMKQLGEVPGMQLQASGFDINKLGIGQAQSNTDIARQMQENQQKQQYDQQKAEFEGKRWAAKNTAMAMDQGGGTWLCTEANHGLTDKDRAYLKCLRMYALETLPKESNFYLQKGYELVKRMKKDKSYVWEQNVDFAKTVVSLIESSGMYTALRLYEAHVNELYERYWPDCEMIKQVEVA